MKEKILFTSESVSEGHPDKVCDQISDSILDVALALDSKAHVACEVFATGNTIILAGEIRPLLKLDYKKIVKDVLKRIGYDNKKRLGTDYHNVKIHNLIKAQSEDIAMGVERTCDEDTGAGDQGIMFGYATDETDGYMPLAIVVAHKLVRVASELRKKGEFKYSRPDMKSQVTIDYSGKTPKIHTILMSCSHDDDIDLDAFKKYIHDEIMVKVAKSFKLNTDFLYYINPTGKFVISGPLGDTGLTGRKIIVDTYGGYASHGGGAFSGKDPTKVDRTAAYMARYIAKNLVAAGVAKRLEVELSYAIGMAEPLSISIKTFQTSKYKDEEIISIIREVFDCRPGMIVKNFSLNKPTFKYADLCNYGHFGRPDLKLPWEKLDKVNKIKKLLIK